MPSPNSQQGSPLHLLKGARFDLPDPFAGDMELRSEVLEGERRIDQPARLEDVAFAVVEDRKGQAKRRPASLVLLTFGEIAIPVGTFLHQPVLPLDRMVVFVHRYIERHVTAQPPIHFDHVLLGDAKLLGNEGHLIRAQIAILERRNSRRLALGKLKNNFFWLAVVPIFTSDHERMMYSLIAALIHQMA